MNRAAVWLAVAVAAAALLGAGLLRFHGGRSLPADPGKPGNLGKDVLAQLRQQGSNLGKPHSIDFYFYFPTRAAADKAAGDLRAHGFAVSVDRAAAGEKWLCLARRRLVPDQRLLDQWGRWFEHVALSHRGDYDGWDSSVER